MQADTVMDATSLILRIPCLNVTQCHREINSDVQAKPSDWCVVDPDSDFCAIMCPVNGVVMGEL